MKHKPKVLVLKTDGINRDEELAFAFAISGADSKIVHINDLRSKKESLTNYNILAIPGGFAYGDDIVSGKILAIELTAFLGDQLRTFIQRPDTLIIGICNGFQVLVRTGLVPFGSLGEMKTTLTNNDSGHFECRWVPLRFETNSACVFLNGLKGQKVLYPVAHGEGKFFADAKILRLIEDKKLVVLRYIDENGKPTQKYPLNPNGALGAIGGICDTTGRIFGLMPHPECFIRVEQHPNWRREKIVKPQGLPIFENMVSYVKSA